MPEGFGGLLSAIDLSTVSLGALRATQPTVVEAAPIEVAQPLRLRLGGLRTLQREEPKLIFDPGTQLHAVAIRPELISIIGLLAPDAPRPRSQVGFPVCPTEQASDTVLYEDAQDPAKHYYLPRYELKTVDGKVAMHIHKHDAGWRLSIDLQYTAAPELGDLGEATELEHTLAVILRYQIGPTQRERVLKPELDPDQVTTHATLDIAKEAELDEIVAALTDPDLGAQLILRRAATVALPVAGAQPIASAETTKVLTAQPLLWNAALLTSVRDHRAGAGGPTVRDHRRPRLAPPAADVAMPEPAPATETAPPPSEPQFRETAVSLDWAERELFVFSRERYDYVYSDVEGGPANLEMKLYHIPFGDRQHRYYRDPQDPSVFHYLPDAFKLSRRPKFPHEPSLIVRYVAGTHGLDDMKVELSFVTVPYTDPARLQDAAQALPAKLEDPLPAGTEPAFMTLSPAPEKISVSLSLPGGEGAAGFRHLDGARVDLPTVVSHTLEVTLEEFKRIYEALLGAVSVLFQGSVSVEFADGTEQIPLHARIDDMVGSVFEETEKPGASEGSVHLTLRNAIESPLTFSGVSAQLVVGKTPHSADIAGIDTSAPIDLAPGAEVELEIVPTEAVSGKVEDAVLDFTTLEVKPDVEKIYNAILDPTAPRDYIRAITVRGTQFFAAAESAPVAVLVEFERGSTAELTPDKKDADGVVNQPLADYVLANVVRAEEPTPETVDLTTATYRYKVTVITPQGGRTKSPDWIEETADILYPVAPPVAVTP
jgi:hypothetical protein